MSRRATDEELGAARELAREVQREGGLSGISLNELLEAFSVRRFTDASRDRLSEALEQADLTAEPSLYDVERGDHLTLTLAGRKAVVVPMAPERPSGMPLKPAGGQSTTGRDAGSRRVGARSASGHTGELGAVAASTGDDQHGTRRWYQRPKRLAAIAAVLLLTLVWLGDDDTPDPDPTSSPGVVLSGGENSDRDDAQDQERAEARQRRADAREARERRQRRAEARAAEKRRRVRAARAARKQAAVRRARRERREAQAAALVAEREAEAQAAEEAAVAPSGGGDCAAGYEPCIPSFPPDLDCADTGPVTVSGSDPHGLDADNDGVACGGD